MNSLSRVYQKIVEDGIEMFSYPMPEHDAVTVCSLGTYGIFVDYSKFENSGEEFSALAHEYGHCATGCTHKLNSPYQLIAQHEYRANRAAVQTFLPLEVLLDAADKGYTEPWQLSDALGIPEDFIRTACEIYQRQGKL